jgi:signal transduction histidine kinase
MTAAADYRRTQDPAGLRDLIGRWPGKIGLAAAVAGAYFLIARLSFGLLMEPDGTAAFWPAAGVATGVLIALGPQAQWPVGLAVIAASIPANLMGDRGLAAAVALAFCEAAEALIIAGLVRRYQGLILHLGRLRTVLGLLASIVAGVAVAGIGGAIAYKLLKSPEVPLLTLWRHWFASHVVGIVVVAPLFMGIPRSFRRRPVRGQIPEALTALWALTVLTMFIVALPARTWESVVPIAALLPVLLWLAARFRSIFSAAGGFLVSLVIVGTAIHGSGHFGDPALPAEDRIFQAQAFVLVVMLLALVLAALFAERRRTQSRLFRSNVLLEREHDNKLMNIEAVTAAIAHEIRQPLSAIALDGAAGAKFLEMTPPDYRQARECLRSVIFGAHQAGEVFESVRNLFRRIDETPRPTDINEIVRGVLSLVRAELRDRGVTPRIQLAPELPFVPGNGPQLHEVILNLVQNALEAMDDAPEPRVLEVRTELFGTDAIVVTVRDSGPGINADKLEKIFEAFFTTKRHGMGMGLAICRMIVERHHGTLTATSDGKNGAQFRILLPATSPDEARAKANELPPQPLE